MMKITATVLSIPPYLSTTWKNITSLHVREEGENCHLIVTLQNRLQVEIPRLQKSDVEAIFDAHAKYSDLESLTPNMPFDSPFTFTLPLKGDGQMIDSISSSMQHSPDQADLPPLPPDVLEKITTVAKVFGLENSSNLPKAHPDCNCMYCQVIRTLKNEPAEIEEEVAEEDLRFRNWDIVQKAEKLYHLTNPLDSNEHYDVFLGEPLGCTCGAKNCEHIRAVLNS